MLWPYSWKTAKSVLLSPLRGDLCIAKYSLNHFHHQQGVARKAVDSSCNCWLRNWCSALHFRRYQTFCLLSSKTLLLCNGPRTPGCTLLVCLPISKHPRTQAPAPRPVGFFGKKALKWSSCHLIRNGEVFYSWRIFVEWKKKKRSFLVHPVLVYQTSEMLWETREKANMQVSPTTANVRVIWHACKVGCAIRV